jgi:hypothetical protein
MRKFKSIYGFGLMLVLMSCDFSNDRQNTNKAAAFASPLPPLLKAGNTI